MDGLDLDVNTDLSAVENFLRFNRMSGYRRKIAPLSSTEDGFVDFSERELVALCWKRPLLRNRILEIARPTFATCSSIADVRDIWLAGQAPGVLIKDLLVDIAPTGLTVRQRGKLGFRAAVVNMTKDDVESHLEYVRDPMFDPRDYAMKGYLLSGSFRTDGLRLQLSAYKLKELQGVCYRRFPDAMLPPRLTSTVGGTNHYLQEIRNVVRSKDDVARLRPHCSPENIKVLCLDLGQAFVVAGTAFLPTADKKGKSKALETDSYPETFFNICVKQKAVYQPAFKLRRWHEDRKRETPEGADKSVEEIESSLPPLRGPDMNVAQYIQDLEAAEERLDLFYNGSNMLYKSHAWDSERAREEEYMTIANNLLKMIGGSAGAKRDPTNMAVIGIGLGNFSSSARLTTLHSAFLAVFVPLVIILY